MSNKLWPKKIYPSSLFQFPFSRFLSPWEDFEQEIQGFDFDHNGLTLSENDNNLFVEAQMPGLKPENIDVTLEKGLLRIQGKREEKEDDKERKYHRKASYSFSYHIALPEEVDENKADAIYKDGVMKLTFPKAKQSQAKRIEVKEK